MGTLLEKVFLHSILLAVTIASVQSAKGGEGIVNRFVPNGMPEHHLIMYAWSNATAHDSIPEVRNPVIDAFRPFSAVLENGGERSIVGFTIEWTLFQRDGSSSHQYQKSVSVHAVAAKLLRLPGISTAPLLRPMEKAFISPLMRTTNLNEIRTDHLTALLPRLLSPFEGAERVELRLDAVIFEDGTLVGPDKAGLGVEMQARLDAEQDLKHEINAMRLARSSAAEILDYIGTVSAQHTGAIPQQPDPTDMYAYFKKEYADELLAIQSKAGMDAALGDVYEHYHTRRLSIRKSTEP